MAKPKNESKDPEEFIPDPEYYEEKDSFSIYAEEKRVGKIFGVRNKKSNEFFIRLMSRSKGPWGWKTNYGFNIYSILQIDKIFNGFHKIARKIGWKLKDSDDINEIKKQLREKEESIIYLQQQNEVTRRDHDFLMERYIEQTKKLMESRVDEFKETIGLLKQKIKDANEEKIPENELQEFLYNNPWLFGTEYVSVEPQKLRGGHSKFDFYLERFNKTNDVVEIKLLSDPIINKDGTISAKVVQAVDQLIDYLESTTAAAHSTVISEEEEIKELRPRGILIIGKDSIKDSRTKLQKWNYRLNHIQILTYQDVLEKAEAVLKNVEKQEVIPK